eukprot:SAG31_NODE_2640_length_5324_cov_5.437835_1_plen_132_part_00
MDIQRLSQSCSARVLPWMRGTFTAYLQFTLHVRHLRRCGICECQRMPETFVLLAPYILIAGMGVGRTNDRTTDLAAKVKRATAVLDILARAGSNLKPTGGEGMASTLCEDIAQELHATKLVAHIRRLRDEL